MNVSKEVSLYFMHYKLLQEMFSLTGWIFIFWKIALQTLIKTWAFDF